MDIQWIPSNRKITGRYLCTFVSLEENIICHLSLSTQPTNGTCLRGYADVSGVFV